MNNNRLDFALIAFWFLCLIMALSFWGAVIYLLVRIAQAVG